MNKGLTLPRIWLFLLTKYIHSIVYTMTMTTHTRMKRFTTTALSLLMAWGAFAWQSGDTVFVSGKHYVLKSDNLIPNPGFEDGFIGWTDATSSRNELTSDKFTIQANGGVDNSKYLVGNANENNVASGSIGTAWSLASGKTYVFGFYIKSLTSNAAGKADWVKVSQTSSPHLSTEPKLLIDGATYNAGNQWTLNAVGFTNSNPTYTYLMARFRWLDGLWGFDNFSLHEAFEMPDIAGLQALIAEAQALYADTANGAEALATAIATAETFLTSESASAVIQAKTNLSKAITDYRTLNATSANPVELTARLVNPGFDDNTVTGWTNPGTPGYHSVEFYQKTFDMYQKVASLPAGRYRLQVRGYERPKSNDGGTAYRNGMETIYAQFYAKSSSFPERSVPFPSLYQHRFTGTGQLNGYVNTMQGAEIMFNHPDSNYYVTQITDIYLTDGAILTIGARSNFQQSGYWALFDDFRLFYEGPDFSGAATLMLDLVTQAGAFSEAHVSNTVRTTLNEAITAGQLAASAQPLEPRDLALASQSLTNALEAAKTSQAAYAALLEAIEAAEAALAGGNDVEAFQSAIDTARATYNNLDADLSSLGLALTEINRAVLAYKLANASGTPPTVITVKQYTRGSSAAFLRGTFSGTSIAERGICWATHPNPTVLDNRSATRFGNTGYLFKVDGLQPSTVYYMRAYAMTTNYAVGYGEVIKVITIPRGTVTYTMAGGFPEADYTRVNNAMSSAVAYYNNYTSIKGLHLSVNYGSGTPTAEASYGGWMRFGPSASYQQTGTALHEMGHTIGVGTHWYWNNGNTALKSGGTWHGERANAVLNFMDNTTGASVKGDNTHGWPYGINGAHEDQGTDWLYTMNALLMQGLGEDGLPTPSLRFTTPAYTFEHVDSVKYYLKSEDPRTGRDTSFLINKNGTLELRKMTAAQAAANDSTAWYLTFNPVNCYYTLRNVGTGQLLTYASTGTNGIRVVARENPTNTNYFQLMGARITTQVGSDGKKVPMKGYYIIFPNNSETPPCLTTSVSKVLSASSFDISNTATLQRWVLVSEDELPLLDNSFTDLPSKPATLPIEAWTENGHLVLNNLPVPSTVTVQDLLGRTETQQRTNDGNLTVGLSKGIHLVTIDAPTGKTTLKVLVP